jgi:tripartite-type tricarboxylate transporter receptor subunit TctC
MAGTGSKQEDEIITVAVEQQSGAKFAFVPFKGGGEVAKQLVGKHVNSTVNNPIEAVAQWRAGNLRPLCVFDGKRIALKEKVTATMAWGDIPTCKEQGLDIEYLMLRGIFMPAGVSKDAVDYYVDLFKKVRETPEWTQFMANGAFNTTFMTGTEYRPRDGGARLFRHSLTQRRVTVRDGRRGPTDGFGKPIREGWR